MLNTNKEIFNADVVICGGALAGMTLALALIKKDFSVIIVDPKSVKDIIHLDKRTTAVAEGPKNFYLDIGVWNKIKPHSEPIKIINIKDGNSDVDLNFNCAEFNNKQQINSLGHVVENTILLEEINLAIQNHKKKGSFKRIRASVTSISATKFSSKVNLSNKKTLTCNLVVASDGKHSITRKMMDIGVKNFSYNQVAFVCNILHEKSHNNIALEKFLPGGPLAILPMKKYKNKNRSSIIWSDRKKISMNRYKSSIEEISMIEYELETHCKDWLGKIKLHDFRATFPLELTVPRSLISNRFILMGDSAHSIHPIAGQGFNLTIRDIKIFVNECNERRELGLDIGSLTFLKNYERKRILDINSLVKATHSLNRLFENNNNTVKFFRRRGLSIVDKSKLMKIFFMRYAMGI